MPLQVMPKVPVQSRVFNKCQHFKKWLTYELFQELFLKKQKKVEKIFLLVLFICYMDASFFVLFFFLFMISQKRILHQISRFLLLYCK